MSLTGWSRPPTTVPQTGTSLSFIGALDGEAAVEARRRGLQSSKSGQGRVIPFVAVAMDVNLKSGSTASRPTKDDHAHLLAGRRAAEP